ncbi:MAG: 1-phosphofructokinase [Halomonadaceae bacterium T82-2]|nr:MAG: 1-phosphofructokinase [Halomonadaceae bacterium T82-2]
MARILAISLNPALDLAIRLPQLALGRVNRTESTHLEAAGKGVNVARVLVALGHDVTVSGFLGAANDGVFVRAFADLGVEDACRRVAGETRINAKVAEHDGRVTDINGPGLAVDAGALEALRADLDARADDPARRPDAVVIAGSLPPGVDAADLVALIARLGERDIPVWVDTSGPALTAAITAGPTAVKPNEQELADWAGGSLDGEAPRLEAVRRLHAAGIAEALISAGQDGVLWASRRGEWLALPPSVAVTSTVGAGDTLVAAMLHGVLSGHPPEQVLRFATALSAEAVRHVGVGDPHADDFNDLQRQTRVQRLDDGARHAGGVHA